MCNAAIFFATNTPKYKKMKFKRTIQFALCLLMWAGTQSIQAQTKTAPSPAINNGVFWKVSGKGLTSPSYLFGTFHLITQSYIDSLPKVLAAYKTCNTVACEIVLDSSIAPKVAVASQLQGTTLDKVLSAKDYEKTSAWVKELTGYDLSTFNTLNPMTVSVILSMYLQQSIFPANPEHPEQAMDQYFQTLGKQSGKTVMGLENIEEQMKALYSQFTMERQVELLMDMVNTRDKVAADMLRMNTSYRQQNLDELTKLMYESKFSKSEMDVLLKNRNAHWIAQLPALMKQGPVFVAVGALHLSGTDGLVAMLRAAGYTVEPIAAK